jgi:hypothetical protein
MLQRITRSVSIVFGSVIDPVGAGFVASLAPHHRSGFDIRITGWRADAVPKAGNAPWLEAIGTAYCRRAAAPACGAGARGRLHRHAGPENAAGAPSRYPRLGAPGGH